MSWQFPPEILRAYRDALAEALYREGVDLLAEANPHTPYEFGGLEATGEVVGPAWEGDVCEVAVGYGDGPDPLPVVAVVQHERTDFRHAPGRTAKWLEVAGLARQAGLPDRVAAHIAGKVK